MTNGELVSRIVNDLRLLNKDEHISRRYVLSIARNKAKFLISQKLNDKSLYRESNIYRTLKCFKLEKEDVINCGVVEISRCKSLMKSVSKLPEMIYSRYGSSILSITTIDDNEEIIPILPRQYMQFKYRRLSKYIDKIYYYIKDDYLYLLDEDIEYINITFIPVNEKDITELSDCEKCEKCKSMWEYEFICPDKILEPVVQETLNEVLQTFKKTVVDENPNLDSNLKT